MAVRQVPQNLDESITLISEGISKVFGELVQPEAAVPSSHTSTAAVIELEKYGGPLGVKKLEYANFTENFVESFKKTPVQPLSGNPNDLLYVTKSLIRSRSYEDKFREGRDCSFVSDLYFPVVCVLRSHILYAWDRAPEDLNPELLNALESLLYEFIDDTGNGTQGDMVCTMVWRGQRVPLLRFEYKNNGYALHKYAAGHSIAELISRWRDEQPDNLGDKELAAVSGSSKAYKVLLQVRCLHGLRRVLF
jgi:hypothetical protein